MRLFGIAAAELAMLCTFGSFTAAQSSTSRGLIDGAVADTSLAPIANVSVSVVGSSIRVATGANGRFQIVGLPAGHYVLALQHPGYAPASVSVDIAGGDTARLSLTLDSAVDSLAAPSVVAAARRAEFETHRSRAGGQFMSEAEITTKHPRDTRELLRLFSLIRIQGSFASSARANTFRDACRFQLFVNAKPLTSANLDRLPEPTDLLGIEVYGSLAAMPTEYRAFEGEYCGAIVAWSKR